MHGIISLDEVLTISADNCRSYHPERTRRMVGLLFLKPHSDLISEEILNSGEYFHARTGKEIDFFLPGYGGKDVNRDDNVFDIKVGNEGFVFNALVFVDFIKNLQSSTTWQYSGETDLLLLDIIVDNNNVVSLDTKNVICCNLDYLINNDAIASIHRFFEIIVQFTESGSEEFPTASFSNIMGIRKGKDGFVNFLKKSLPGNVSKDIENVVTFKTSDIEKL